MIYINEKGGYMDHFNGGFYMISDHVAKRLAYGG